jgi:LysR family transcriptional regulator for bpeEF and oprC
MKRERKRDGWMVCLPTWTVLAPKSHWSYMNQFLAIRSFARVVETSSFTKAADSMDMPKASVSKLVQELEAYLGVRLLQRTTRQVTVTEDGHAYYQSTNRLLQQLQELDQSFSVARAKPSGKIRVDVGGTFGRLLIVPALPSFFARYPEIQIELGVGDRFVDVIGDNVDCAVRGGPSTELAFASRLLATVSWTTCATPQYLEKFGRPLHPHDLSKGHTLVGYHSALTGRPIPAVFQKGAERIEIEGPYLLSVNDGASRSAAGLGSIGVLQTFSFVINDELHNGELVPILQDWVPSRYPFHVVYPPNRNLSRKVRVFIDWLVETFDAIN